MCINCLNTGEEIGRYYGFPECCIESFMQTMGALGNPLGAEAGNGTGFIPCPKHAQQVIDGDIKLEDLINNRECETPFPIDDMDTRIHIINSFNH